MNKTLILVDPMSDKSTSDENETILDRNSKNSAQRHREAENNYSDRRREKKSGEERTLTRSASRGSEQSGKDVNVEGNQTPKMDMNKTVRSERPGKKSSIFDYQDDDDVFEKKTPKNARPAVDGQQAEKIQNRRSSRVFELKRKSTQSGMDDETDEEGKKRRGQAKQPSTSQVNQIENGDNSQNTESDEEEVSDTEIQKKARVVARSRSAHNQKILRIINQGSEAQLKSLSRIGPKTATMLHQYRKLHGRFTSINELEDMPGWTPKVFEQFLKANNIIFD